MADCREQVYSDEFFDFIVSYEETNEQTIAGACIQRIDEGYDIFYYPREGLPPLNVGSYSYSEIPKCYGLLDQTALEVSGILKMQNQPVLALKGRGVLIGFIDTGIDYTNPAFRYSDGSVSGIRPYRMERRLLVFCMEQNIQENRSMRHCFRKIRMIWCRHVIGTDMVHFLQGWHVEVRVKTVTLSGRRRSPRSLW